MTTLTPKPKSMPFFGVLPVWGGVLAEMHIRSDFHLKRDAVQ
jgi:hypothetical protein